jgi:O-methyltransferase involved in polyketide biosynthesis
LRPLSSETSSRSVGYRESARTFILWEGVTNYLTDDAVDSTLRWCARASVGSLLLFTYVHRDILTRPSAFAGTKNLFAALEKTMRGHEFYRVALARVA